MSSPTPPHRTPSTDGGIAAAADDQRLSTAVQRYYGSTLRSSADLRTSACCDATAVPEPLPPLPARVPAAEACPPAHPGIPMARILSLLTALVLLFARPALADETTVLIDSIGAAGVGAPIGNLLLRDTSGGLRIISRLSALPPGEHGLHVHQNPDCGPAEKDGQPVAGLAAGGHFDPGATGVHAGPLGEGHLGDLPRLSVRADGTSRQSLLAPRLTLAAIRGHAVIVHAGGDNYADQPAPLGGGGARVACGLIP